MKENTFYKTLCNNVIKSKNRKRYINHAIEPNVKYETSNSTWNYRFNNIHLEKTQNQNCTIQIHTMQ